MHAIAYWDIGYEVSMYTHVHEVVKRRSVLNTQLVAVVGDSNIDGIMPDAAAMT